MHQHSQRRCQVVISQHIPMPLPSHPQSQPHLRPSSTMTYFDELERIGRKTRGIGAGARARVHQMVARPESGWSPRPTFAERVAETPSQLARTAGKTSQIGHKLKTSSFVGRGAHLLGAASNLFPTVV